MTVKDVFEEWNTYSTKRKLLNREVALENILRISKTKLVSITGIRRCGKSSLMMLIKQKLQASGEKAAYINLEDTRLTDTKDTLDEVLRWFGDEGTLLLDEVTAAPDYEGWLARNHELLKGRLNLIISSSRRGLTTPSKPLRGRIHNFELYPLSFIEYLDFKKIPNEKTTAGIGRLDEALTEYLKFGGYPEVVLAEDETDKVTTLGSYLRDIVGLDVAEVTGIPLTTVKGFSDYALQAPIFSASKATKHLSTLGHRIGKETALTLEHYTETSYLIHYTHIYAHNIKDQSQYPRKAYPGDTGFIYALQGRVDYGRLYENAVFLELKRRHGPLAEISYWRGQNSAETDFVVKTGSNIQEAIQVSFDLSDKKTLRRELKGLTMCNQELKVEKAYIISSGLSRTETFEENSFKVTSLIDWLIGEHTTKVPAFPGVIS
jgi:predicted AAA+ superfamily ATPase